MGAIREESQNATANATADFKPDLLIQIEGLKQHQVFKYVDSAEKFRLFGQYYIFLIWNYQQMWNRLSRALYESATADSATLFSINSIEVLNTYLTEQLHQNWLGQAATSSAASLGIYPENCEEVIYTGIVEPHYKFWSKVEINFAPLEMLYNWLRQHQRSCPPLTPLNFALHLTNFIRYTIEATMDLLPHELAANLFISVENLSLSKDSVMHYYHNPDLSLTETTTISEYTASSKVALDLLELLCQKDKDAWREANLAAKRACIAHTRLWDGVEKELQYFDVLNFRQEA